MTTIAIRPVRTARTANQLPRLPRLDRLGSAVASAAITVTLFCGIALGMSSMADANQVVACRAASTAHA